MCNVFVYLVFGYFGESAFWHFYIVKKKKSEVIKKRVYIQHPIVIYFGTKNIVNMQTLNAYSLYLILNLILSTKAHVNTQNSTYILMERSRHQMRPFRREHTEQGTKTIQTMHL